MVILPDLVLIPESTTTEEANASLRLPYLVGVLLVLLLLVIILWIYLIFFRLILVPIELLNDALMDPSPAPRLPANVTVLPALFL